MGNKPKSSGFSYDNKTAILVVILTSILGGAGYLVKAALEKGADAPAPPSVSVSGGSNNTTVVGSGNTVSTGIPSPPSQYSVSGKMAPILVDRQKGETLDGSDISAGALQDREGRLVQQFLGIHQPGYPEPSKEKPSYASFNGARPIEFQIGGHIWNGGSALTRFAIVNKRGGPYIVESLYLKLQRYAECPLRDETMVIAAPVATPSYAFYLTPQFNVYELVPQLQPGAKGEWKLGEGEADDFMLSIDYPPYILFLVSIVAEVRDQSSGGSFRITSDILPYLGVANGNSGGCLDLATWYRPEIVKKPIERAYRDGIDDIATYQALTIDAYEDRTLLLKVVKNFPDAAIDDLDASMKAVIERRADNPLFKHNYQWLQKFRAWHRKGESGQLP